MSKPRLAVLMLSWLRFDSLIKTLESLPITCDEPLHLILRVQGVERLSDEQISMVKDAARNFYTSDIYFTHDNIGTAAARLDLLHRCAQGGYEYSLFTDDDISFPHQGIDQQIAFLSSNVEAGSVSLTPSNIGRFKVVEEYSYIIKPLNQITTNPCEVFLIGSASLMFKTDLYTKHLIAPDPEYYIGTWDWDFVTQIRSFGYKLFMFPDKFIINHRGGEPEYLRKRKMTSYIDQNYKLFLKKWNFDPFIGIYKRPQEGDKRVKKSKRIRSFIPHPKYFICNDLNVSLRCALRWIN